MNNDFSFDPSSGPIMSGSWVNPKNGDMFTVRDVFFQDNQLIVLTTDGRSLDYNMISDYIKSDKPEHAKQLSDQIKQSKKNIFKESKDEIPSEILNMVEPASNNQYSDMVAPEDIAAITPTKSQTISISNAPQIAPTSQINLQVDDEDLLFIKRVLRSVDEPTLKIDVNWKSIPVGKLDTLINMLGVDVNNIVEWVIKDMDLNKIRENVKKSICEYIESHMLPQPKETNNNPSPIKKTRRVTNEKRTN